MCHAVPEMPVTIQAAFPCKPPSVLHFQTSSKNFNKSCLNSSKATQTITFSSMPRWTKTYLIAFQGRQTTVQFEVCKFLLRSAAYPSVTASRTTVWTKDVGGIGLNKDIFMQPLQCGNSGWDHHSQQENTCMKWAVICTNNGLITKHNYSVQMPVLQSSAEMHHSALANAFNFLRE